MAERLEHGQTVHLNILADENVDRVAARQTTMIIRSRATSRGTNALRNCARS